ncbi:C39 family peptidase [Parahaliea mediterranea]|nr:cysteine peptidase family C39 domain-containing protein [Parahaliea mediterranea]
MRILVTRCRNALLIPFLASFWICANAEEVLGDRDFRSWKELRDHGVVKQSLEYSCGLAALATLLTHYFQQPISEEQILSDLLEDEALVSRTLDWESTGVSLWILRYLAQKYGYVATGLSLDEKRLRQLRFPAVAALEHDGFAHFTVLRGVGAENFHLADPSWGNTSLTSQDFMSKWLDPVTGRGKILLLSPKSERAERNLDFLPDTEARRQSPSWGNDWSGQQIMPFEPRLRFYPGS